jgi:hypothetical protein
MCRIDKKCKNQAILQDPSGCKKILATVGKRFNLKLRDLIDIKKRKEKLRSSRTSSTIHGEENGGTVFF